MIPQICGLKFTTKGGKGSGHRGHLGGEGGEGKPGGSRAGRGFGGAVSFAAQSSFGRAHPDGSITFDKKQYSELDESGRTSGIAHEVAHNTVEDFVLKDSSEWDKAETALLIREGRGGRKLFFGGNTRLGESISDALGSRLAKGEKPASITHTQWGIIQDWSQGAIKRAGYNPVKLQASIVRIRELLDKQL